MMYCGPNYQLCIIHCGALLPASGYRHATTAELSGQGVRGDLMTASVGIRTGGIRYFFAHHQGYDFSGTRTAYGWTVRCVKQDTKKSDQVIKRLSDQGFLPASGYREYVDGITATPGDSGNYWSSSSTSIYSGFRMGVVPSNKVWLAGAPKAYAFTFRCVKQETKSVEN